MHARAVSIENTRYLDTQIVLPLILEEQRLGAALAFIIAGAGADWIDVAPILFHLRMNAWVAVDLRGGRLQDLCAHPLGESQHVDSAMHTCFCRLHWIALVVDRRCRASHVVALVDLDIEGKCDIMADEFKVRVVEQVLDIAARAAKEIVDANDNGSLSDQAIAKMRTEETRSTGD